MANEIETPYVFQSVYHHDDRLVMFRENPGVELPCVFRHNIKACSTVATHVVITDWKTWRVQKPARGKHAEFCAAHAEEVREMRSAKSKLVG